MSGLVYERLARQATQQYASKTELLYWVNDLLELKVSTLYEFQTGAIFCQILDAFFPDVMPINKVNFFAFDEFGSLRNFKIFQQSADALQGQSVYLLKDLKADKIIDGHISLIIEYLQFLYKNLYDRKPSSGYNPKQRRKQSLNGGTEKIPITYFQEKEQAFKLSSKFYANQQFGDGNLRQSFDKDSADTSERGKHYQSLRDKTPARQTSYKRSIFNVFGTPPKNQKSSQEFKKQPSVKTPKPVTLPRQASKQSSKQLKQQKMQKSIVETPTTPEKQEVSPFEEQENLEPQSNYDNESQNLDNSVTGQSDDTQLKKQESNVNVQASNLEFLKSLKNNQHLIKEDVATESLDQAFSSIVAACQVISKTLPRFQQLVEQIGGKFQKQQNNSENNFLFYALKGKVRSMRDVIGTLFNHSMELVGDLQNVITKINNSNTTKDLQAQLKQKSQELSQYEEQYLKICELLDLNFNGEADKNGRTQDTPNVSGLYSSQDQALQSIPVQGFMEEFQQLDQACQKVVEEQAFITKLQANDMPNNLLGSLSQKRPDTKPLAKNNEVSMPKQASPQKESKTQTNVFRYGELQIRVLSNGDVYKGRYVNKLKNGHGVYSFKNGDIYFGEFKDDLMHGVGVYSFADQGRYEGQWSKAVYQNFGMESFAHGSTYHGMYQEGMRHGFGVCRYFNGDYYEGQWQQGQREGKGMQQCTDDSNFVGDYRAGKRHGYGIYTFPNQDQYLGEYQDDIPHGYGVYVFKSGQKYEGQWQNGLKHGWCEYTVENGEVFAGSWEQGKAAWVQYYEDQNQEEDQEVINEKSRKSKEAADQAKLAMEIANDRAMSHWDEKGEMQNSIQKYLGEAEDCVQEAQKARLQALKIAELLDGQAQTQLTNVN